MSELIELSLPELRNRLDSGDVSPEELVKSHRDRLEQVEGTLKSFERLYESALDRAKSLDVTDYDSPLAGIPVAIKDNLCVEGREVTCSSKILEGFVPPYTATAVQRLRDAGAIVIGATNMDEFAMGSSTENSAHQITRNPHDPERVPGGSSGGSAAAVASGEVPMALGSDTGGSVRQPASLCGVVGMKPTYGRVSRYGLIAFASSLDQIGPITRTVKGSAMVNEVIAGHDSSDSTSLDEPVPSYSRELEDKKSSFTVGVPEEYFTEGLDQDVRESVRRSIDSLEDQGCTVKPVELPHTEYAISVYYVIATAEASSNLARYDGVQYGRRAGSFDDLIDMYRQTRSEGFGDEVKRRIMLGTFVLSSGYYDAYYGKAQKVRTLIQRDFDEAFESCDVLVTPTSPSTAFTIGDKIDDPVQMYLSDICTISANLAGIPALSVPVGTDSDGLPIGAQVLGPALSESNLLQVGQLLENTSNWNGSIPEIAEAVT
jgi:aspartyl-tRNA(Asn)/glutamyl-tRNA(Gln) amidotransferase subunit A